MDNTIAMDPAPGSVCFDVEHRHALSEAFQFLEACDSMLVRGLRKISGGNGYEQCLEMVGPLTDGVFIFPPRPNSSYIFSAVAQRADELLSELPDDHMLTGCGHTALEHRQQLQLVMKMLIEVEREEDRRI